MILFFQPLKVNEVLDNRIPVAPSDQSGPVLFVSFLCGPLSGQ